MCLKEEFDLFLASAESLDLSCTRLPSVGNPLSFLDTSCNTPMEYQDYWSRGKQEKISISPLQNKSLVVQGDTGTLKEKWLIQISIKDFQLFPGDSFGIYPPNKLSTVESLMNSFPQQPHYVVNHLKFRADLTAFPKKGSLKFLGDACADEKERQFLYFLSLPRELLFMLSLGKKEAFVLWIFFVFLGLVVLCKIFCQLFL